MKTSKFFLITQRETPAETETASHQLMLRAGMIRQLGTGIYTWMPLGLRVLRKLEQIIREELNAIGAMELFMPAIQPAELWQESGRWETFSPPLLKMEDRHQRAFCFGPTHEEVVADVIRHSLKSYKQLPLTVFQIQSKFRDELRPRAGVMRAREFLMNDSYSFHLDSECLQTTYDKFYQAYRRIFTRTGLDFRIVQADTGDIGGTGSHEFHVLADSGEDRLVYSDGSDYAANMELATAATPNGNVTSSDWRDLETHPPSASTSKDVPTLPSNATITFAFARTEDQRICALAYRSDHTLNLTKLSKIPTLQQPLTWVSEKEMAALFSAEASALSHLNTAFVILADFSAANCHNFKVCLPGASEEYTNVNWQRDLNIHATADLREVVSGDDSPDGCGNLHIVRGIEVGHIFQLGDKYSRAMNVSVLDPEGKQRILQMGCYGIGVSRVVAAAIEQNHDDHGITWPDAISPFQIAIIPVNLHRSEAVNRAAHALYEQLNSAGYDVLMDDRKERPGILFADMDLIGIPHHLIISDRTLEHRQVEYKHRRSGEKQAVALDAVTALFDTLFSEGT